MADESGQVHPCCGGYLEHRYRCPARVWPATATPEIRRQAIRGDCIAPAHAQIEDLVHGLDWPQRKQLTGILARVWDDGFGYSQQIAERAEAVRLLEEALHLRMNGEYAPGGTENWADWGRETEAFLRGLLPPEREDENREQ